MEEPKRFAIIITMLTIVAIIHTPKINMLTMLIIHVTMSRYQAMRGKMDSLVRVLEELKQTVGQALGPNVAHQMARAAETVKDIAYA